MAVDDEVLVQAWNGWTALFEIVIATSSISGGTSFGGKRTRMDPIFETFAQAVSRPLRLNEKFVASQLFEPFAGAVG